MKRRQRRVLRSAAGAFVVMASATCWATEPRRYELDYVAEDSCPSRAAFEQLVQTQLAEFGDVSATIQARASVRFRRATPGVVGRFDLERQDGSHSSRELESASCEEAASALAFVLALALGGREPNSDVDPSLASGPPLESQRVTVQSAPSADRARHASELDSARAGASRRWQFGVGVQLGARTGVGPSFTPVEGAFIALRGDDEGPWDLNLRLAFLRGQPIAHSDRLGTTSFKWLAGRIEGCPFSTALVAALTIAPCLLTHVGQLTVVGTPEPLPGAAGTRAAKLWLESGGALRLELRIVKGLSVEAQGEALVPLTRYHFAFDRPDTAVYRVPPLAGAVFFGLAAHFP